MFTLSKELLAVVCMLLVCGSSAFAQRPTGGGHGSQQSFSPAKVALCGNGRGGSGVPMDGATLVTLVASVGSYNQTATTRDASTAVFDGLAPGDYEAEASYPGYQTATEHITVNAVGSTMQVYIYMIPESDKNSAGPRPQGLVMSPKLQGEIDKGLETLRKSQFEIARAHFAKGLGMAPGNPDISYLLGTAELGLNHTDVARQEFEHAFAIDPTHHRSLLALGELQLRNGETSAAIVTLEKAFLKNGAGWRTHLLLASAYAKAGRLPEAETQAQRAVDLAREKGAGARLLLGQIQLTEGKLQAAQTTLQELATKFPGDPFAAEARKSLASLSAPRPSVSSESAQLANLPVPVPPTIECLPPTDRPWAPLDIDSREYPLPHAPPCTPSDILLRPHH